ncbi:MAG: hypothetical protein AAB601_00550, partial [Patescibacteria group bacterium]
VNASGGLCIAGDCKTAWSQVQGTNYWTLSGNDLSPNSTAYNVAIGHASPQAKLDIRGFGPGSNAILINDGIQTEAVWGTAAGGGSFFGTTGLTPLYLRTGGANNRITILSGGTVGINQDAPGARLAVNNSMTAGKTGATGDAVYAYANSVNAALSAEQANASGYALYASGRGYFSDNVGIGTASPGQRLTVANAGAVSLGLSNTAAGGTHTITYDASNNFVFNNAGGASRYSFDGSGGTGYLTILSGSGWGASTGNVGIGTTNPGAKLDVIGAIRGQTGSIFHLGDVTPVIVGTALTVQSNLNGLGLTTQSSPTSNKWAFRLRDVVEGDFAIYDVVNSASRIYIKNDG